MRRVEHGLAAGAVLGLVLVLSPWPAEAFCLHTYTG